jgi:HSP20 family protein
MSTKALARTERVFPSIFEDFMKPWNQWLDNSDVLGRVLSVPAVNVHEDKDNFILSVAAPGLKKSDFNIDVDGNLLTISSEKEENKEEKDARYTRKEYNYSSFSRTFTIPEEVKQDKIEAEYENGVLKVTLPKKEEAKKAVVSKHIAIK